MEQQIALPTIDKHTALIVLDVQNAIDDPRWNSKNNPDYIHAITRLLQLWRTLGWPVVHIRHDEANPASTYYEKGPGNAFKQEVMPMDSETVIVKRANCAFIHTDLEQHLRTHNIQKLVFTGVVIHNSMDVSIRVGHALGFEILLPLDATTAIDVTDIHGQQHPAQQVFDLYASVLASEYCQLTQTDHIIKTASADKP